MTDIAINPVTRRVQFQGTTGTGPFAFNFNILQASDIAVYKNNTLLSIGTGATNYSVSIASNGTGSVSVVTALITSDVLVIIGGRELSRTTDFVTAGDLLASSLNEQLDSNVVMSQQLDESISRSIRAQPGDTEKTLTLPLIADRANEIIKFDSTGNVTTIPVSEILGTDIDTQKVTVKTSGGVVKAVIDGNTTNILTVTGPVVLKEGTNTRITINPAADNNSFTSDANFSLISTSGDIDIKPGGGQVNLLGTSGQQRIAFDNAAQATMQYFQNSNITKLGVVDPTGTRTLLLPNASDTLVGKATTDTLTNKTLASPVITGSLGVGTLTGSGDILLDAAGDIVLDAAGDQVFFKDGGTLRITFNLGASGTSMVSASDLVTSVTSGSMSFKTSTGNVDFLQNSGAQAVQINSAGSSTITYYQNSNTTKLGVVNPTASRVLLLPNASDTLVGLATTDTLTNKTLASPVITGSLAVGTLTNSGADITLDSSGDIVLDAAGDQIFFKDAGTTRITFELGASGTSVVSASELVMAVTSGGINFKPQTGNVDFLTNSGGQALQINAIGSSTITYYQNSNTTKLGVVNPTGSRVLLLPDASDTLVGKATTDTLTNKTLTSPTITGSLDMSDVNITNVGSISLDKITNDGGAGITLDSSQGINYDAGSGQNLFKVNGQTRLTVALNNSANQTITSLAILSLTSGSDINLRPNGGQLYVLNNAGGDNFQFNTSSTPTLGIHQNSNVTNLGLVNPTATRTILFPDASDTLVGKATTDTLTNKTLTSPVINTGVSGSAFLDEDNFASNSATKIASQQSIKAYVDAATAGGGAGSLSTVLGIGNTTGSNNVLFGDNNKAIFGAGSDLQIYHDGSNNYIESLNSGWLNIPITGNGINIANSDFSENLLKILNNGGVELYHNGSKKFETTSTGVSTTGTTSSTGTFSPSNSNWTTAAFKAAGSYGGALALIDGSAGYATYVQSSGGTYVIAQGSTSGALTTRMQIDSSGDVGIGVVPSATSSYIVGLQIGEQANLYAHTDGTGSGSSTYLSNNIVHNSGEKHINSDAGSLYQQGGGSHSWYTYPSGSAGATATPTTVLSINPSGNLGIGTTATTAASSTKNIFLGGTGNIYADAAASASASLSISQNAKIDTDNSWEYIVTDEASNYYQNAGNHVWRHAASGSAGADISWIEGFRVGASESVFNTNRGLIDFRVASGGNNHMLFVDASQSTVSVGNSTANYAFHVNENRAGNYVAGITNDGNNVNRYGMIFKLGTDDGSGTNTYIAFDDGDGSGVGAITGSGGTITYATFTAVHPAILPDADNENGYAYGTLLDTTEITYSKRKNGQETERGIRYKVVKSASANSRKVLGAYAGKDPKYNNEHLVNVLGDGHILCNNSGGNIDVGDGICTSVTAGIGQKATASPSMIIGIAQEAITFSGTETKLVPVQYGLQQFTPWS